MPDIVDVYSVFSYTTDYVSIADPLRVRYDEYVSGPAGLQGPIGPVGPDGTNNVQHLAYGAISGHRVVLLDEFERVIYADALTPAHASRVLGISINAGLDGETITIRTHGELQDPSFAFTPGRKIFAAPVGAYTQIVPTSGFMLTVGYAITATKMFVAIQMPIMR